MCFLGSKAYESMREVALGKGNLGSSGQRQCWDPGAFLLDSSVSDLRHYARQPYGACVCILSEIIITKLQ